MVEAMQRVKQGPGGAMKSTTQTRSRLYTEEIRVTVFDLHTYKEMVWQDCSQIARHILTVRILLYLRVDMCELLFSNLLNPIKL